MGKFVCWHTCWPMSDTPTQSAVNKFSFDVQRLLVSTLAAHALLAVERNAERNTENFFL